MPSELEERLERALGSMPGSGAATERRARVAALEALGRPRRRRRPARGVAVAVACVAVLATTAGTLAEPPGVLPSLRVMFSPFARPSAVRVPPAARPLPQGARAFVVATGSRTWVWTRDGAALRGARIARPAPSPGALYLVGAVRGRLVAVSRFDRHVAWSRPIAGTLAGAAWSPYPIRVAYVDGVPGRRQLHVVWGNGEDDQQVAAGVAPVTPAWRSDSLAFAYALANGRVAVHAIGRARPTAVDPASACGVHRITALAFAPGSATLAEATDGRMLILADTAHPGRVACVPTTAPVRQLAWTRRRQLVYTVQGGTAVEGLTVAGTHAVVRSTVAVPGTVAALAAAPGGGRLAIAFRVQGRVRIVVADPPRPGGPAGIRIRQVLGPVPQAGGAIWIAWR